MKELYSPAFSIKAILERKGWIDIPAYGVSMYPFIKEGDICRFIPLDSSASFKKGDIFLFQSEDGRLVGHRYIRSFMKDQVLYHSFKGDTNVQFDPPVLTSQLIGKLDRIKKRSWHVRTDGMTASGWGKLVFSFPFIPRLCKKILLYWNQFRAAVKEQSHGSR